MTTERRDMSKYQRVKNEKKEKAEGAANELYISPVQSNAHVKRALALLLGDEKEPEAEKFRSITLMGRGKAVSTVVQIAEFLKRRVAGLHQISTLENAKVVDEYEPKPGNEGLENFTIERSVGGLRVQLSLDELDSSTLGYQPPLPADEVTETGDEIKLPSRSRARKSGGRSKKGKGEKADAKKKGAKKAEGGRGAGAGRGGSAAPAGRGRGGRGAAAPAGRGGRGRGGRGQ